MANLAPVTPEVPAEDGDNFESKMETLVNAEWKLMRDQLRKIMHLISDVQHKVEDVRLEASDSVLKLRGELLKNTEVEIKAERQARVECQGKFEKEFVSVKDAIEVVRKAADQSQLISKTDTLAELLDARRLDQLALEDSIVNLRNEVDAFQPAMEVLRDTMNQDARERKVEEENIMNYIREHDRQLRDVRVREDGFEASLLSFKDLMEQDRSQRDATQVQTEAEFNDFLKEFKPVKEELPVLRGRVKDLEESLVPKSKDHQRTLEKIMSEQVAEKARGEQRVVELFAKIDAEKAARRAREEELDASISTSRLKLEKMLSQQADTARQANETTVSDFHRAMEKELAAREAQHEAVQEQMSTQKTKIEDRLGSLQKSLTEAEQALREEARLEREGNVNKKAEELSKQIRDLREALVNRLSEERASREVAVLTLDQKIAFLNGFFQDIGQRFGGPRASPFSTPGRSVTPARMSVGGDRVGSTAERLQTDRGTGFTLGHPSPPQDDVVAEPPKLAEGLQRQLTEVLDQQRVELVLEQSGGKTDARSAYQRSGGDGGRLTLLEEQVKILEEKVKDLAVAELKLKEPLQFKPLQHGDPPVAYFKQEDQAMDVLGDIAEVLKVYKTATVLIEGHVNVPEEKMDSWAAEVAQGRAEMVKSTITSFGIEPTRLETRGLSENTIDPRQSVVLKITSF